jgi:glycerophosphoryl diester phosphodiesterase
MPYQPDATPRFRGPAGRRGGLVLFVLMLTAGGCAAERPLHAFFQMHKGPIVFSHRGGGGVEPEATLPAILNGLQRNPQAVVEFDVHQSSDGHLVVIHDDTVDRTTNGTGAVAQKSLAELQGLDAGYCATPGQGNGTAPAGQCHGVASGFRFRGMGYRIPTLEEVLAALPAQILLSVEVKQAGIERKVADVLRASGRLQRLIVGAEPDEMSVRLRDALPEVPHYYPKGAATCLALSGKARWSYAACPQYEVFASPLSGAGLALDTEGVLDSAHADGVAVVYWTINDKPTMLRLFRLGADGIFTDYPDLAREALAELRGSTP